MPKFLLITISILVLAGHIFAVQEYSSISAENENSISLEDIYFDENYEDHGPIQIIESPSTLEKTKKVYINDGGECIFFDDEGIPWLDKCPIEITE